MKTAKTDTKPPKPCRLPLARSSEEGRLTARLRGHTTSEGWLQAAVGLDDELDRVALEHQRLVGLLHAAVDQLHDFDREAKKQDAEYMAAVRSAAKEARPTPADDRVGPLERQAARSGLLDRVWSMAAVVAESADEVVATLRRREDRILSELRGRQQPAREKQATAKRLMEEAARELWRPAQLSRWTIASADDVAFREPCPVPAGPPSGVGQGAFEVAARHWSRPLPAEPASRTEELPEVTDRSTGEGESFEVLA